MDVKGRFSVILALGFIWTCGFLILYKLPLDPSGAAWRSRAVFIIAWFLGLVLLWMWSQVQDVLWTGRFRRGVAEETIDPITGLPNRSSFHGIVQGYLDACGEQDEKSLILLICVKDLDRIAKSYGDEEAERIMVRVSRALFDSVRGADLIGRHDKDELVSFLPKASSNSWEAISKRIHMNVDAHNRQFNKPYQIAVSTGHAEFDPVSPLSLELLIRQAYDEMIKDLGKVHT